MQLMLKTESDFPLTAYMEQMSHLDLLLQLFVKSIVVKFCVIQKKVIRIGA